MTLEEYKKLIIDEINELNANPCFETLAKVEASIDFYSDWYKDENFIRPRNDIGYFRSLYSDEAREVVDKFEKLDWQLQVQYMYPEA